MLHFYLKEAKYPDVHRKADDFAFCARKIMKKENKSRSDRKDGIFDS